VIASVSTVAAHAGDPALVPLEDRIQLIVLPHELVAIDGRRGEERRVDLRVGERVLSMASDGQIAIARTEQRLLAIAVGSAAFQERRYFIDEVLTAEPELGDRVALVVTNRRVLGFEGGGRSWRERRLGPRERVIATAVANYVAAVVTDRRAFGLSPQRGGFFEVPLTLGERVLSLEATGDVATLRLPNRLLIYRAPDSRWSERTIGLGY
jgi:hypothetical protein